MNYFKFQKLLIKFRNPFIKEYSFFCCLFGTFCHIEISQTTTPISLEIFQCRGAPRWVHYVSRVVIEFFSIENSIKLQLKISKRLGYTLGSLMSTVAWRWFCIFRCKVFKYWVTFFIENSKKLKPQIWMQIGFQTWDKEGVSFKFARFGVHQGGFIIFRSLISVLFEKILHFDNKKTQFKLHNNFFWGKIYYKSCLRKVGV